MQIITDNEDVKLGLKLAGLECLSIDEETKQGIVIKISNSELEVIDYGKME